MRRCAATRERLPKEALVRLAVAPDGMLVPDIEERLPGRGLWIAARRDIEALLGHRVHLELFVKVEEDWRNSAHLLDEYGLA